MSLQVEKPANPANWWISGNETAEFTYTPGPRPFYVVLRTAHHIVMSALFWGIDEQSIRDVLGEMVDFGENALNQYRPSDYRQLDGQESRRKYLRQLDLCLKGKPADYELTIVPFIPVHPVRVSWARNDIVL